MTVESDAPRLTPGSAGGDHQRDQMILPRLCGARAGGLLPPDKRAVSRQGSTVTARS